MHKRGWDAFDRYRHTDISDLDPCNGTEPWFGLTCRRVTPASTSAPVEHVVGITMWTNDTGLASSGNDWAVLGNGLRGSLPNEIGDLERLEVLDLGTRTDLSASFPSFANEIVGTTPQAICNLVSLQMLRLRYVKGMHGAPPSCLGATLKNLSDLGQYAHSLLTISNSLA